MSYHALATKTNGSSGVQIKDYENFRRYYCYREIRDYICVKNEPDRIAQIVGTKPNQMMSGIIGSDETPGEEILKQECCGAIFPVSSSDPSKEPDRKVSPDRLTSFLQQEFKPSKLREITLCIEKINAGDIAPLTTGQAYEILLFAALFAYVDLAPSEADQEELTRVLEERAPHGVILTGGNTERTEMLPDRDDLNQHIEAYLAALPQPDLIRIRNNTTQTTVIRAGDASVLQRKLAPGAQLLAVAAEGKLLTFLPRICAVKDGAMIRLDGHAVILDRDHRIIREYEEENIAFFSHSRRHGLLAADDQGVFLDKYLVEDGPDKPVCFLRGDGDDYGFLFPDGSYQGYRAKKGWTKLVSFDLCRGGSIGVTADNRAIDKDGKTLGTQVAAASCCAQRWILLHTDGSVETDRGRVQLPDGSGRVVCADEAGYWVSTDRQLLRILDNRITDVSDRPMDEIIQDNDGGTVCGVDFDGNIQFLY